MFSLSPNKNTNLVSVLTALWITTRTSETSLDSNMSVNEVAMATTSRKWSELVAKGQTMKVPTESIIIFERDDLAAQMKLHRGDDSTTSLEPGYGTFRVPRVSRFGQRRIFKMIEKQLGLAIGFRTVSHPNKNRRGNIIIIEAKLTEDAHAEALSEGLMIQRVKYLGTPTKSTEEGYPDVVKVHVSGVPLALPEEVKEGLLESLKIYGPGGWHPTRPRKGIRPYIPGIPSQDTTTYGIPGYLSTHYYQPVLLHSDPCLFKWVASGSHHTSSRTRRSTVTIAVQLGL
jgi:hypothetical protein